MIFTQILFCDVFSLVCFTSRCDCFSRSRLPSRLEADTTPTAAAAAAAAVAMAGLDSIMGSAPGAPPGSHGPSHQRLRRLRPLCSRSPTLSPSLPSPAILRALSVLYAVNLDGIPLFNEVLLQDVRKESKYWHPGSPLSQYILDQGPAL